jgi:hypothetical protein
MVLDTSMLSVVYAVSLMLADAMKPIIPSVVMLSVIMLTVFMLSIVMLIVVKLGVVVQ